VLQDIYFVSLVIFNILNVISEIIITFQVIVFCVYSQRAKFVSGQSVQHKTAVLLIRMSLTLCFDLLSFSGGAMQL